MDTDVSWANFNNFEAGGKTGNTWDSTSPDGKVLHSNPPTPDEKRNKYSPDEEVRNKYSAEGESYRVEEKCNGETQPEEPVPEKMEMEQWPPVSQEITS